MTLFCLMLAGVSGCVLLDPSDPYGTGPYVPCRVATSRHARQPVVGPVTLSKALEVALSNNPEIAARSEEVAAAQARRDVAFGAVLPAVSITGGYSHFLNDQRLIQPTRNGEPGAFGDDIFSGDIVVSMPLYAGGRLISEIRTADLLREAASHTLARSKKELVFNVSSVFYNILAQRKVIESLEYSRKALREHLKRVRDMMSVQKTAKVDVLRTEVRLADIEYELLQERNVLAIEERTLSNLMGIEDPQGTINVQGELVSISKDPGEEFSASLALAYRRREDYLAARAALEAQAGRLDAARAARWPTVSFKATYGGRWAAGTSEKPAGTDSADDVGSAMIVVDIPVFEGGRIAAGIREQRANLFAARQRLRKLELQIRLEVETASLNLASARQRVHATEKSIEQAKESLRIEQRKYSLGKASITDVLDAQSALLDAQRMYFRALAEYRIALAQLRLATGEKI